MFRNPFPATPQPSAAGKLPLSGTLVVLPRVLSVFWFWRCSADVLFAGSGVLCQGCFVCSARTCSASVLFAGSVVLCQCFVCWFCRTCSASVLFAGQCVVCCFGQCFVCCLSCSASVVFAGCRTCSATGVFAGSAARALPVFCWFCGAAVVIKNAIKTGPKQP
jgi:hypothetical protein